MTRQEFITELRTALEGQVSRAVLQDNINYYETYIMQESRKGRTEEEVLEELGNPRLIAKTIIDSTPEEEAGQEYHSYQEERYEQEPEFTVNGRAYSGWKAKAMKWTTIIALIGIVIGIIALVAGVISLLAPILVPLLIIILVVRMLSRK
jgi:uncharacterized membrane protein